MRSFSMILGSVESMERRENKLFNFSLVPLRLVLVHPRLLF
jgi:hypothetical protein